MKTFTQLMREIDELNRRLDRIEEDLHTLRERADLKNRAAESSPEDRRTETD